MTWDLIEPFRARLLCFNLLDDAFHNLLHILLLEPQFLVCQLSTVKFVSKPFLERGPIQYIYHSPKISFGNPFVPFLYEIIDRCMCDGPIFRLCTRGALDRSKHLVLADVERVDVNVLVLVVGERGSGRGGGVHGQTEQSRNSPADLRKGGCCDGVGAVIVDGGFAVGDVDSKGPKL